MFETFRSIRSNILITVIACLAVGAALLIYPDMFLQIICYVMGALFVAYGVLGILRCVRDQIMRIGVLLMSVLSAAAGIFIITQPRAISSILPIIIGLILLLDGILNVRHGLGLRRFEDGAWKIVLVLGIITVLFGAVILFHPSSTATLTFRLIGAALLYNGISDLIILLRMNRAAQRYDGQKVIDVEARPVDDDEEEKP